MASLPGAADPQATPNAACTFATLLAVSATDFEHGLGLAEHPADVGEDERRRLLMISNPYATTVSSRLKNLVISALRGSYLVDAIDTERRDHATEICREAAQEGYDAIVAFGGDGTVNEAANGLAGTGTPLTCLPGGRANVYCRMLGIPADVIDATEHLLELASGWTTRQVDLGCVDGRHFLFSAGVGLDASVVQRVDAHPRLKARLGEYYYAWVAATTFGRRYLVSPPRFAAELGLRLPSGGDGRGARVRGPDPTLHAEPRLEGVTAIVQNATPYTYFGNRGVEMAEGASLHSGDLAGLVLRRTSPLDIPSIAWRALSGRSRVSEHRQIEPFSAQKRIRITSLDERPLPMQVDGDFVSAAVEHTFWVVPAGLTILA